MDLRRAYVRQSTQMNEWDKEEIDYKRKGKHCVRYITGFESLARQQVESGYAVLGSDENYANGIISVLDNRLNINETTTAYLGYGNEECRKKARQLITLTQDVMGEAYPDQLALNTHALILDEQLAQLNRLKCITAPDELSQHEIVFNQVDKDNLRENPQALLYHARKQIKKPFQSYDERKAHLKAMTISILTPYHLNATSQKTLAVNRPIEMVALCRKDEELMDFTLRTVETTIKHHLEQYVNFLITKWGILKTYPRICTLYHVIKDQYQADKALNTYRSVINLAYDLSALTGCIQTNLLKLKQTLIRTKGRGYDGLDCEEISMLVSTLYYQTSIVIALRNLLKRLQSVAQLQLTKIEIVNDPVLRQQLQ